MEAFNSIREERDSIARQLEDAKVVVAVLEKMYADRTEQYLRLREKMLYEAGVSVG
jgi:hypothetical protein